MSPSQTSEATVEEIRRLTERNRADRDDQVEEQLVVLRHEAFDVIDRTPPAILPPPIVAEPPIAGPLPEFTPEELDLPTLRAGLARHGCVLVRGLVSPERAEALAEGIDHALDGFDRAEKGEPAGDAASYYVPFRPRSGRYRVGGRRTWVRASGGVWTVDSPRMLYELLELVDETGIGDLIAAHLGERPALSANKCTLRRVPVDSNTNWHQDGAFLGEEIRTLNLWLALSHCGVDAPGLDIVPRRIDHVLETGTDGAIFDWSVSPNIVEQVAEDAPVLRPEFGPGDALLFDQLFLHRTAVAPGMTRERHAIETWFFAPSTYPDGQIPIVF